MTSHGKNFTDFALCRTFLGVCEAVITPAFLMITGAYWKREEQPFRAGIWYSMNGLGSLCGSLITYGVGQIVYSQSQRLPCPGSATSLLTRSCYVPRRHSQRTTSLGLGSSSSPGASPFSGVSVCSCSCVSAFLLSGPSDLARLTSC